jgi:hypothetical protein
MEIHIIEETPLVILPSGVCNGQIREPNLFINQHIVPAVNDCLLPSITWHQPTKHTRSASFMIPYKEPVRHVLKDWQVIGTT